MFASNVEGGTAGHQDGEVWATGQQVGQVWGGGQDLLEVVEQEQQVFVMERSFEQIEQGPRCGLFEVEGLGDGGHDQGGVADGGERNEGDAIGKISEQLSGDLQGQTSLADASGAGEREQADLGTTQEGTGSYHFPLTSNEGSELCGHVVFWSVPVFGQGGRGQLKEGLGR